MNNKSWQTVRRADGVRRYPTFPMLRLELLRPYAARFMGESVLQSGDPVRRYVFHCQLRSPMALLVSGHSNIGKSMLAGDLEERNIPILQTDQLLGSLVKDKRYEWSPVLPRRQSEGRPEPGRARPDRRGRMPEGVRRPHPARGTDRGEPVLHRGRDPAARLDHERARPPPPRAGHPALVRDERPLTDQPASGRVAT